RLDDESGFRKVATSKKKNEKERLSEIAAGTERQQQIKTFLTDLGAKHDKAFLDRDQFREFIEDLAKKAKLRIDSAALKAIVNVLSERDENARPCRDSDGAIEPDPELRDTENVPLSESIQEYFEREVRPYVADAWINESVRDPEDNQIGKVGFEINFNRYFYKYQPPRPLEQIEADIRVVEQDILKLLGQVV